MKTLHLTDTQFALLQAILNSEAWASDQMADAMGEAAAELLDTTDDEDADIEAQINLQNSLVDALTTPTNGALVEALIQHHVDTTAAEDTMALLAQALGTDDYDDRLEAWGKLCSAAKGR